MEDEAIGERRKDGAERMFLYYNRHGLVGNKNVLEWLIGRKATDFREWAEGKKRGFSGGE